MCGIAGYYHQPHWENAKLTAMVGAIRHRGPDGDGFYFKPQRGVGLGHARLSILDLSPLGAQPMTIPGSGSWIVYNGEVYNFIELRRELSERHHRFRSDSDTEVVLSAWLEWGEAAFCRFNGMWALAIYDETADSLLLCRDRYGVKPLYYHRRGDRLVFGSEYKAFLPVMGALGIDWDQRGIKTALTDPFQLESSGHTLFEGIANLPPGHLLRIQGESCTVRRWWDTRQHLRPAPPDLAAQAEEFKALLQSSCRLRMRSDVPVGTSLSGGLDSSSVAVMLASLSGSAEGQERWPEDRRKTFVHSFPGTPLDETDYAEAASAAAGVQPIRVVADPQELPGRLDETLYALEGIYIGMPDSAWRIYRAQRAHGVIVSLDGHGADEMLGGYDWHVNALLRDTPLGSLEFWRLLKQRSDMLCGVTSRGEESSLVKNARMAASAAALAIKKTLKSRQPLLAPTTFLSVDAQSIETYPPTETDAGDGFFEHTVYNDFHHRILPRILRNFDLMSMAHGVEIRMPFLDYRLVDFCFSLPVQSKIKDGYTKVILREAMKGLLPDRVRLRRQKIGFNSPLLNWLPGLLRPWVEECLSDPGTDFPMIDRRKLRSLYEVKGLPDRWDWWEGMAFWKHLSALKLVRIMNAKRMALTQNSAGST
jgi:asparagine synthase (glutamine-hydrolysing)